MQIIPAWSTIETTSPSYDFIYFAFCTTLIKSYLSWRCILYSCLFTFSMGAQNSSKHCVLVNFHNRVYRLKEKGDRRALGQCTQLGNLVCVSSEQDSSATLLLTLRENVLPGYEAFVLLISALYTRHAIMIGKLSHNANYCPIICQTMETQLMTNGLQNI